ncbi:MAG: metallophosphoesterase [Alistipes onderdonkii]
MHLDLGTPYRRAQAEKTIAQMRYILDAEHPDLVVFTGDVVTGKPAAEAWHRVLEPVAERNLRVCVVRGTTTPSRISHARRSAASSPRMPARSIRSAPGANWPTWCWRSPGRRNLRRCSTASTRTIIQQSVYRRLRLVYSGAGGLVSCPQRRLYRGQRREALPALAFSISPCPNTSLHGGTPTIRMSAVPPRMNAPGR